MDLLFFAAQRSNGAVLPERIAATFWQVHADPLQRARIIRGVTALEGEKLWTWEERLNAEIESVEALHAAW